MAVEVVPVPQYGGTPYVLLSVTGLDRREGNVLVNPSFEQGMANWTRTGTSSSTLIPSRVYPDDFLDPTLMPNPDDGNKYITMEASPSDPTYSRIDLTSAQVAVPPGVTEVGIQASFFLSHASSSVTNAAISLGVVQIWGGGAGVGYFHTPTVAPGMWTKVFTSFKMASNISHVQLSVQRQLRGQTEDNKVFYVDNAGIFMATTATGLSTIYREIDGKRIPVRGGVDSAASAGVILLTDYEVPYNRPFRYVVAQALSDGTTREAFSDYVTVNSDMPWLSDPISGLGAPVVISEWPEKQMEGRREVIQVSGRSSPVVVSDKRISASSSPILLTRNRDELESLRAVLDSVTGTLQLRTVCEGYEDDYLDIGTVTEERVSTRPSWIRLVTLEAQSQLPPPLSVAAVGNTLEDLANAFPGGTLKSIADAFPGGTLLDIAKTNFRSYNA